MKFRDYQKQLFEVCVNQNSILYLPTGSGKTLIAVKVIDHFTDDRAKAPLEKGGKRSLFLVNTLQLGYQVTAEIKNLLGFEVACWNSETHKKSWSKARYHDELDEHQVIVATAQLFLDAVKHSYIKISQLNVVVYDECHHGRMNHPYHELMKQFMHVEPNEQPRIVGLSGMLIGISSSITEDTVEKELAALESTFLSTIVTVHRLEEYRNVLLHSTNPKESFLRFDGTESCDLTKNLLERVAKFRWELSLIKLPSLTTINPQSLRPTKAKKLKELELLFEDFGYELKELGLYGGFLGLQAIRVQFELIKNGKKPKPEILKVVNQCLSYVDELMQLFDEAEVDFKNVTAEDIVINSTHKVRTLIGILGQKFKNAESTQELQSLVFVQRRFSAKCLYHLLKNYAKVEPNFPIRPDFVVGINSELPESIDEILSDNQNKLAIEKFRMKQTNCICTSSVLEEGIDLQMCNLVVMYDLPTTFRSYIQSKGRARTVNSDYIVLTPRAKAEAFVIKRNQYEAIDRNLKEILIGKTCDRALSEDGIDKERLEQWNPLITRKQALVNSISSVALLNRYVSRFANANLLWDRKDLGPNKVVAIIRLPRQSKIKEVIESDVFDDIKLSKQNAAFKACTRLYEIGELDEHLMPKYY